MKFLDEIKREISDFDTLPTYDDAKQVVEHFRGRSRWETYEFFDGNSVFQILNKEFVEGLAKVLNDLHTNKNIPVIEVCAGSGKLTHHLKKQGINIIATDSYKQDYSKPEFVEKLDHIQSIMKYSPEIVIASWIPMDSKIGIDAITYPSTRNTITLGHQSDMPRDYTCGHPAIYKVAKCTSLPSLDRYSLCMEDAVGMSDSDLEATNASNKLMRKPLIDPKEVREFKSSKSTVQLFEKR